LLEKIAEAGWRFGAVRLGGLDSPQVAAQGVGARRFTKTGQLQVKQQIELPMAELVATDCPARKFLD
jgi:hypothetical protein